MLNCLQCGEQSIIAQQFGRTSNDASASLCDKCRQLPADAQAVHRLLQKLPRVTAPADFEMRLQARLARAATAETKFSWWAWPRWSLAGGGLAGLALAGALWGTTFQGPQRGQSLAAFPSDNIRVWPVSVAGPDALATTVISNEARNKAEQSGPLTATNNNLRPISPAPALHQTETLARNLRVSVAVPRVAVRRKPRVTASETPNNNSVQDSAIRRPGRVFSQTLPAASPTPSSGVPVTAPATVPSLPVSAPTPDDR